MNRERSLDALGRTERRIMRLWDAGMSIQHIATRLDLSFRAVQRCVTMFHAGAEVREGTAAMALASARLRDAIVAARRLGS